MIRHLNRQTEITTLYSLYVDEIVCAFSEALEFMSFEIV